MRIRRATIEDAELLSRLNAPVQQLHWEARPEFFKPHAVTEEMIADFRYRLSNENIYTLIGEVDEYPIGYILAQIIERPENPYTYPMRFVLIDQMSVNPDYRSKGYGDLLIRRVFDLARSLDIDKVFLSVGSFNQRAIAFYERHGFVARDIRMEAILS
ncbi:MAG: GNAT family N-acetyltransferase [Acidobacteria bacterium]|nr:GNAT family N-acetyltransferase [Acidobacteriota bacterium]